MIKINRIQGFSLVELAIVLVIVSVLIGSFIGTIGSRIENTRRADTEAQLELINDAITGYASTFGRIPCPAEADSAGLEAPAGGGTCDAGHGFIPGLTLGLRGAYNEDNLLLDSWGNPIRYSVTTANGDAFTETPGAAGSGDGMRGNGMAALSPNLIVCDERSTSTIDCAGGSNVIVSNAPYIIISLGKDGNEYVATAQDVNAQDENSGEVAVTANAAGENIAYLVSNDIVFVNKTYSGEDSAAGFYDDIVLWGSPYVLYTKMMEAGQLP